MLKLTVSRRRQRVSLVTTGLILTGSALLTGCSKPPEIQKIEGYAQGTTYHISWWSDKAVANDEVQRDFNTTLAQIDEELSTYRDDSYNSHFNHNWSTSPRTSVRKPRGAMTRRLARCLICGASRRMF